MEMVEAENLDLIANGRGYCTTRKCQRKHFWRSCLEYVAVTPTGSAIVVASLSGLGSHILSDFISSRHSPFRA